jgi:uncharacterized membrane protein YoaK (UPF0700 family)
MSKGEANKTRRRSDECPELTLSACTHVSGCRVASRTRHVESYSHSNEHSRQVLYELVLPLALSATAGAVDVTGFLALGGLFTAHITGNLVVLAAHYITGSFGQIAPLIAVPMFVVVLAAVTVTFIRRPTWIARRALLILPAVLLAAFVSFAVAFGPFPNPDSGMAVFVGMLGVAAMAIQNAVVKMALLGPPSTAPMTTNVTQLTIDLASVARRQDQLNDGASPTSYRRHACISDRICGRSRGGCASSSSLRTMVPYCAGSACCGLDSTW